MQLKQKKSLLLITFFLLVSGTVFSVTENKKKISIDVSERFRLVSWDNPITLDDSRENGSTFTRQRTSVGVNWGISSNIDLYFKATNEFRYYFKPDDRKFNIHEVFIDNLYFKIRNIFNLPVSLTLGRQNLFLGEGFIVLDGSTFDGSRSAYFDAIRADINFNNGAKLILFNLYAQKTDENLPIINNRDQVMNEHDLKGFGAYYQGKIKKNKFDIYFLNKESDINENGNWDFSYYTLGSKITFYISNAMGLTTETALQTGHLGNKDFDTFGGHFHMDKTLRDCGILKNITFGGVWLSGDSSPDDKVGSWDAPFSKWPKWSESYIYTLINENGIANWSNISSLYLSITSKLFNNGLLKTTLHYLLAPEKNNSSPFPGGTGKTRGLLLMNKLNFKINKNFSGHLLWEHFRPGNFYFDNAKPYNWFRFELMYRK